MNIERERRFYVRGDASTGSSVFVIQDGDNRVDRCNRDYYYNNRGWQRYQGERQVRFGFPQTNQEEPWIEKEDTTLESRVIRYEQRTEGFDTHTPALGNAILNRKTLRSCSVVHLDEQGRISPTSSISSVSSFIFNDNTLRSEALGSPILDRNAKRTSKTLTAACMLTGIVLLAAFVLSTIVLIPNAIPGTEGLRDTVTHTHIGYCIAIALIVVMLAMGLGLTSIGTRRFFHKSNQKKSM